MLTEQELVEKLALLPHPEGGFYKETYRSELLIAKEALPEGFGGSRNCSTAIYYLLPAGAFSAFHRIRSDEGWHFYDGLPLNVYVIHLDGKLEVIRLGRDVLNGETYQAVVPAGCWFASKPMGDAGYSLAGCTVSPGFDFADFEMADREHLINDYPQHSELIKELTR